MMKRMPYKVEEDAVARAKYRAKMAIREVAHPAESQPAVLRWRWAMVAAVAVVAVAVVSVSLLWEDIIAPKTPMEQLIVEMKNAPDDIIKEWAADASYYAEDTSTL